jgi:hypothetical protein
LRWTENKKSGKGISPAAAAAAAPTNPSFRDTHVKKQSLENCRKLCESRLGQATNLSRHRFPDR